MTSIVALIEWYELETSGVMLMTSSESEMVIVTLIALYRLETLIVAFYASLTTMLQKHTNKEKDINAVI